MYEYTRDDFWKEKAQQQTALIERNYHCGTNGADGTYGRLTAYAVRCFQASKGLIVNGRADRYTIAALGGTWKE